MTKSSQSRINSAKSRKEIASTALHVAAHGRLLEVEVDGKMIKFWAMPESHYQAVMSSLQALAK